MKSKSYHHGDLRNALIETGIELINEYGEEKLSLRKVATKCGVSNAAPYAHFKNKDIYISPNWPRFLWILQTVSCVWYPLITNII